MCRIQILNEKWIKDLNVKAKEETLPEENMESIHDAGWAKIS